MRLSEVLACSAFRACLVAFIAVKCLMMASCTRRQSLIKASSRWFGMTADLILVQSDVTAAI